VVLGGGLGVARVIRTTIHETDLGLLYVKGRFQRLLGPGRHWIWRLSGRVVRLDGRRRLMAVQSQEILTKDNIQVRMSAMVTFQVADPARALHDSESYEQELYVATQLALRAVVAEVEIDALLERKLTIGEGLQEQVAERAAALGVELHSIELRDGILPGDVRQAFAEVLRARTEGRAALERARGESAALRNLANGARVLEGNPALMNLRILQAIGQEQAVPGTTRFVVHLPDPASRPDAS
jgi:regulator of protease activity HflC (stomatin/prohibitin superfamily)